MTGRTGFPQWLGKNSKRTRATRLLSQLSVNMSPVMGGMCGKCTLGLDWMPVLYDLLQRPLAEDGAEGIPAVIDVIRDYALAKEDVDAIVEIGERLTANKHSEHITPATKSALTRAINASTHKLKVGAIECIALSCLFLFLSFFSVCLFVVCRP
jgi:replication factor C subunit 1